MSTLPPPSSPSNPDGDRSEASASVPSRPFEPADLDDPWASESDTPAAPLPSASSASPSPSPPTRRQSQPSRWPDAVPRPTAASRPSAPVPPPAPSASWWEDSTVATARAVLHQWQTLGPRLQALPRRWKPLIAQTRQRWSTLLRTLRGVLPPAWSDRLSDLALGGIVVGVGLLGLVVLSSIGTGSAPTPAHAESPPVTSRPVETVVLPEFKTPAGLTLPSAPPATPPLALPPEQRLIAEIQEQLADLSTHYPDGVIQFSHTNFRTSVLTVTLSPAWFTLTPSRQDQLANDLLGRSQTLTFNRLELVDPEGTLVARSPMIGGRMVIYQRTAVDSATPESD